MGSVYATFKRYHVNANEEYTDAKSRRMDVERRIVLASEPLPYNTLPPPLDTKEIYLEVTSGPTKKHRIFGLGNLYRGSPAAPSGLSSQLFATPSATQQQIDEWERNQMHIERA